MLPSLFRLNIANLVRLVTHGETEFPHMSAKAFVDEHWLFAMQMTIIYMVLIFFLKHFMKSREPIQLKYSLRVWNFLISLFSILAAWKMFPFALGQLYNFGIYRLGCDTLTPMPSEAEYWLFLTVISKFFEFIDTFFIVLRKRELIFLHWYHHVVTFLFFCFAYPTPSSQFRVGCLINLAIHSIMYPYYFLRSMNIRVPGKVAQLITILQMGQFLFFLTGSTVLYYKILVGEYNCDSPIIEINVATFMSGSYFILFCNFFLQSYIIKGGKEKYKSKPE